jgi:hypothetical protein
MSVNKVTQGLLQHVRLTAFDAAKLKEVFKQIDDLKDKTSPDTNDNRRFIFELECAQVRLGRAYDILIRELIYSTEADNNKLCDKENRHG